MANAYKTVASTMNSRVTPQSQTVPGKNQVMNNAGGAVFAISQWDYLMRFLILGSEGGTYYASEQKLTRDNAKNLESCVRENGKKVVDMCIEVSDAGRAPKNDPAIFALAMVAGLGDAESRKYALDNLHKVCRIGTHLFHFAAYVNELRGWGHGLRRAIGRWYTERPTDKLAMQLVKYQSRDGWSHRDLIRLSHPQVADAEKNLALRWAVKGFDSIHVANRIDPVETDPLGVIYAFERVKTETIESEIIRLVTKYGLPLEAIPTEKQTRKVLAAALENLGITAIIRNLGRYSKEGILTGTSAETNFVVEKLLDAELLKKGRVHPLNVLFALSTYKSGHGFRGTSSWNVVSKLVDALDESFYISFGTIEPTGMRICQALDVSGSMFMEMSKIANTSLFAGEAAAAMAMVTARVEKNYEIVGFTKGGTYSRPSQHFGYPSGISPLDITPRRRLDDICNYTRHLDFGGTDCALPMIYAKQAKKKFDAFIIYTDNETWAGDIHPFQALKQYRESSGIDARLIVVGMTATPFSIADPSDKGMMDVVGFDTAAPNVMSSFIRGEF